MTPRQIYLARHALGFNSHPDVRQSYRNHFSVSPDHVDYDQWVQMTAEGNAVRRKLFRGDDLFHLTRAGAEAALRPGERLDPEDFPSE